MGRSRTRKRRFHGNQYVVSKRAKLSENSAQSTSASRVQHKSPDKASQSASARKIGESSDTSVPTEYENKVSGYRLIDI